MASAEQELLREFLVRLRYDVNKSEQSKFMANIAAMTSGALKAGGTIVGLAGAVQAYVQVFASQMEKMYYASRRTKSSVENLQAMKFAAKQIGVSSDEMMGAIESFSKALRTNPGFEAWLNNMGVKTAGRENTAIIADMVKHLQKLPHNIGALVAESFGIPEETFLMLKDKFPEFMAAQEKLKATYKAAGYDAQKAAENSQEYMNILGDLSMQVKVLGSSLASDLLPAFKSGTDVVRDFFRAINEGETHRVADTLDWLRDKMVSFYDISAAVNKKFREIYGLDKGSAPAAPAAPTRSRESSGRIGSLGGAAAPGSLFGGLESQFGLPAGLLDSMWAQESSRGRNMLSPKGAMGHFGFMPNTAKEFGLKDPNDLVESATKASEKMRGLLRYYKGDLNMALAGYNWGEGNLQGVGRELGRAPAETQKYISDVTGRMGTLNNETNITINTTSDPSTIANVVGREVKRNWASVVTRNNLPAVQ